MRSSVPSQLQSSKESYTVERGGRSLGIARHWQPVLRMYISPFTTSRTFTVRLLPPRLPGRMSGSTWLHSSSVKSLGYRSLLRSYRARFSIVHIGDLSTTQAATLASQTLDPIQEVPEQALRKKPGHVRQRGGVFRCNWRGHGQAAFGVRSGCSSARGAAS